jgi:hypothetical protein
VIRSGSLYADDQDIDTETGFIPVEATTVAFPDGKLTATNMGILVHKVLEEAALPISSPLLTDASYLGSLAGSLFGAGIDLDSSDHERANRLLANFMSAPVLRDINEAAEKGGVWREHSFATLIDRTILRGTIDALCLRGDRGTLVVDYKTGTLKEGTSAAENAAYYRCQVMSYALAAGREHPGPVKVTLVFLDRPGEEHSEIFTDTGLLEEELKRVLIKMSDGFFAPPPVPDQHMCTGCTGGPNQLRICPTGGKTGPANTKA